MVFTSVTSKLLLVPSSCSVLVQNPGSRSTTLGFQTTEGKQGGILIILLPFNSRRGLGTSLQYQQYFGADLSLALHMPILMWNGVK